MDQAVNNLQSPPICQIHNEQMALCFYTRPGSPPGNGWYCPTCNKERQKKADEDFARRVSVVPDPTSLRKKLRQADPTFDVKTIHTENPTDDYVSYKLRMKIGLDEPLSRIIDILRVGGEVTITIDGRKHELTMAVVEKCSLKDGHTGMHQRLEVTGMHRHEHKTVFWPGRAEHDPNL